MSANPHLKGIVIAGALAAIAVALGMFTLARQQPASEAALPVITPHRAANVTKPKPQVAPAKPAAKPKPKPNPYVASALAAELPKSVAEAFGDHEVVVVSVYTPETDVDLTTKAEAQAGAGLGGAGFVGVDASRDGVSGQLARAFGVLSSPTTLVLSRADFTKPVTELNGFNDRQTVAQAALNADPTPGAPEQQTVWARQAETLCDRAKQKFAALGEIKTRSQLKIATPKVKSITGALMSSLGALPAPAGRAADVGTFLSLAQKDIDLTLQLAAAAVKQDAVTVATATAAEATVGAQANTLAIGLGAPSCAQTL